MISNNPGHSSWNEENVDALLVDFFAREMPAELRHLPPTPHRPAYNGAPLPSDRRLTSARRAPIATGAVRTTFHGRSARAISLVALGVVVLVATALFRGASTGTDVAGRTALPEPSHSDSTFATASPDTDSDVRDKLREPADRVTYDAATEPVEQRSNDRQPATRAKIEVELETLEVEIIPIDD